MAASDPPPSPSPDALAALATDERPIWTLAARETERFERARARAWMLTGVTLPAAFVALALASRPLGAFAAATALLSLASWLVVLARSTPQRRALRRAYARHTRDVACGDALYMMRAAYEAVAQVDDDEVARRRLDRLPWRIAGTTAPSPCPTFALLRETLDLELEARKSRAEAERAEQRARASRARADADAALARELDARARAVRAEAELQIAHRAKEQATRLSYADTGYVPASSLGRSEELMRNAAALEARDAAQRTAREGRPVGALLREETRWAALGPPPALTQELLELFEPTVQAPGALTAGEQIAAAVTAEAAPAAPSVPPPAGRPERG